MTCATHAVINWPLTAAFGLAGLNACTSAPPVTAPPSISTVQSTAVPTVIATIPPSTASTTPCHIDLLSLSGHIVFSDDVNDIWIMSADGSELTQLTTNPAYDFDPARSPNGRWIVFRSERDGNNEIYVMNSDGSGQTNLSNDPQDDWGPAWSPDSTQIVFNSARGTGNARMAGYVMNADGSELQPVGDLWVEYPAWSPDGTRLAFMSQTWEEGDNYEIFVMNADGTGATRLTDAPGSDGHPAWSPDGLKIVFNSERDDPGERGTGHRIWVMNADGTEQLRLTGLFGKYPAWSPDGRYVIFSGDQLYVMKRDGSCITPLPVNGLRQVVFPDWTR